MAARARRILASLGILCMLTGCARGFQHEQLHCKLDVAADVARSIPDEALTEALNGKPGKLVSHLLKHGLKREAIERVVQKWKECSSSEVSASS